MSRSKWKFKCIPTSLKKFNKKIWDKDLLIQNKLVGHNLSVYNGSEFFPLKINNLKVGYKLGEFIYTRKYVKKESYIKKKKIKK